MIASVALGPAAEAAGVRLTRGDRVLDLELDGPPRQIEQDGKKAEVSARSEDGRLVVETKGEQGDRVVVYRRVDGGRLRVDVRMSGGKLKAPLSYTQTYVRLSP